MSQAVDTRWENAECSSEGLPWGVFDGRNSNMNTMPALVKRESRRSLAGRRAGPGNRHQRRLDQSAEDRHLRHRRPHLQVGRLGPARRCRCRWSWGTSSWARWSRSARTSTIFIPARSSAAKGTWSAVNAATAWPAAATLQGHQGRGRQSAGSVCRVSCAADDQRLAFTTRHPATSQAIFDPFGNAVHTALSFDVLGEDVLITGQGRSASWPPPWCGMPGRGTWWSPIVNPYRLELARKMGATWRSTCADASLAEVQKQLGMKEGFDVGLEMSGNPRAFRDMLANMCHGGKIAMLGIPEQRNRHRLEHGRLQHAHHQGHLRPRDV